MLASGKQSDFYIDCRQTSLSAEGHVLIGRLMFELIQKHFPDAQAVGGPTLGADPIVSSVSITSWLNNKPLDAFIVRKEPKGHGTGAWIEGMANLSEGMKIVMLEDTITTGSTTVKSIQRAQEAGLVVVGVIVLVDRLEGARENIERTDCRLFCLFDRNDFI